MKSDKIFKFVKIIKNKNHGMLSLILFSTFLGGMMFLLYGYIDLKMLTVWSLNILDTAWEGNLYYYYEYCAQNIYDVGCTYMGANYIALIPWAVWNIPLWILQKWFGISAVGHAWTLLYSKLFLVIIWIISVLFSCKIMKILMRKEENESCGSILYIAVSFPFAMVAVLYAGQTDIVSICLFVIAIYEFMQEKRKLFLLFSALSIGAKPYVFLAFIAVILLTEKNVWKILRDVLAGVSLVALFHLIYYNAPLYQKSMSMGPAGGQLEALMGITVSSPSGLHISLFIVSLICLYFVLYIQRWDSQRHDILVYSITAPFFLFFLFTEFDYYRMIYLFPFLYLLFCLNGERLIFNLLLETIMNIGIAVKFYCVHAGFFSNWFVFQFVRDIFPNTERLFGGIRTVKDYPLAYNNPICTLVSTVVFAAILLLFVINSPKFKIIVRDDDIGLNMKQILWIRACIPLILMMLSFYGK